MRNRRLCGGFGEQPFGYAGTASIEKPWRRIEAISPEPERVLPRLASTTKER